MNANIKEESLNNRLRNKLSPLTNLIALLDAYEKEEDEEMRKKMMKIMQDSKKSLNDLVDWLIN